MPDLDKETVMQLTNSDYEKISEYAFSKLNPGWRPEIQESPNGDGVWDANKRFAHLAPKYFERSSPPPYIRHAYAAAMEVASWACTHLGLWPDFMPGPDTTIRVLDYPPGATTAPHTDFDLFTLRLYRNDVGAFRYLNGSDECPSLAKSRERFPGIHFGEILSQLDPKFTATEHEVVGSQAPQQSIVLFVVPEWDARLPSGQTVAEWMTERKARSRR
jgi:hypothetical protein